MTRIEAMIGAGRKPRMPNLSNASYLFEAFELLGFAKAGEMGGLRAMDWQEVTAFATGTRRVSDPWEIETLYAMSREYVAGHNIGSKLFGIEPIEQLEGEA